MNFSIEEVDNASSICTLDMEFTPQFPLLGMLAFPLLSIDNWLALNFLLPAVLATDEEAARLGPVRYSKISQFRRLMGLLYGFAGLAHLADMLVGESELLAMAGAPTFGLLPPEGKAYALLWCLSGPLAFAQATVGGRVADIGLISYGLIEVAGALLCRMSWPLEAAEPNDVVLQAVSVQLLVLTSWLYSRFAMPK
jgi:hypothetical protein